MNKLLALCFTLCLSLSALAQSGGQPLPKQGLGDELIVVNIDDLERSLNKLAEALRAEQAKAKQRVAQSQTNVLRLQLLLQLLPQNRQQAPTIVYAQPSGNIVVPQGANPSSSEDRLDRIESLLFMLMNKQGATTPQQAQTIIRKKSEDVTKDAQRIAELEAQLATLLARQGERDTTLRVDTVYLSNPSTEQIQPKVVVHRDTLYQQVTKLEAADFKRSIYFPVGKSELDARSQKTMLEVRNFLRKFPEAKVAILGFASPEGNAERNKLLAERRMLSAVKYLEGAGITSQIETFVGGVDTKARNYQLARRVDIILVK